MAALLRVLEEAASAHSPVEMTQLSRQQSAIPFKVWEVARLLRRLPDLSRNVDKNFAMLVSGIKSGQSHCVAVLSCLENAQDGLLSLMDPDSRTTPLHVLAEAAVATTAWPVSLDWKKGGNQLADIKALAMSNDRHNIDLMHPFGSSGSVARMLEALSVAPSRSSSDSFGTVDGLMEGILERFTRIGRFALARDSRGHTPLDVLMAAHYKDGRERHIASETIWTEIMKRAVALEKSMKVFAAEYKKLNDTGVLPDIRSAQLSGKLYKRPPQPLPREASYADKAKEVIGGIGGFIYEGVAKGVSTLLGLNSGSDHNKVAANALTSEESSEERVLELLRMHYCASVKDFFHFGREIVQPAKDRERLRAEDLRIFNTREKQRMQEAAGKGFVPGQCSMSNNDKKAKLVDEEIIRKWKKRNEEVDMRRFHSFVIQKLGKYLSFNHTALYALIDKMDSNSPEADIRKMLTDMALQRHGHIRMGRRGQVVRVREADFGNV